MNRLRTSSLVALSVVALTLATAFGAERSVIATDANGTYRDDKSEIKILALSSGKLKVQMGYRRAARLRQRVW